MFRVSRCDTGMDITPSPFLNKNPMPAAVISIDSASARPAHRAVWSLLEVAQPGRSPVPFGILLAEEPAACRRCVCGIFPVSMNLTKSKSIFWSCFRRIWPRKGANWGSVRLIESLENGLSHFLRISDRNSIAFAGGAQAAVDRLFEEHVDFTVRPFVSHLPLYSLRAAATKFGEFMDAGEEGWVRVPEMLHPGAGMFVARVVGRSMEPRIPDGSLCVFRAPVVGSRRGRLLLIEMLDVDDASQRYTVKKYARTGELVEGDDRDRNIRLETLNNEIEAFDLTSDRYRVVAEFVQVLPS